MIYLVLKSKGSPLPIPISGNQGLDGDLEQTEQKKAVKTI